MFYMLRIILLGLILTLFVLNNFATAQIDKIIKDYFDALIAGDWDGAANCWVPEVIDNSKRLDIQYIGLRPKWDCASPFINALPQFNAGLTRYEVKNIEDHDEYKTIQVELIGKNDTLIMFYYAVPYRDNYKLIAPHLLFTRSWKSVQTAYVDIMFEKDDLLNENALRELTSFIEIQADRMNIAPERMNLLKQNKLDYYLCDMEKIELFTGYKTEGMYELPSDAIISRHLPHQHEIAHFLINYSLKKLPLYTLPILQEGAAVAIGGRWGKSPDVILELGNFILDNEIVRLDELLSYDGFHIKIGSPDMSYPVSGLLADFLINEFGIEAFKDIYLDLSGDISSVRSFTVNDIKKTISDKTSRSWDSLTAFFDKYRRRYSSSGIDPVVEEGRGQLIDSLKSSEYEIKIYDSGGKYLFELNSFNKIGGGVILLKPKEKSVTGIYQSWMFAEHLPERQFNEERYGIVFDQNEMGLYNYYLNRLEAKAIFDFSPEDTYFFNDNRTLKFYINKNIIKGNIKNFSISIETP